MKPTASWSHTERVTMSTIVGHTTGTWLGRGLGLGPGLGLRLGLGLGLGLRGGAGEI